MAPLAIKVKHAGKIHDVELDPDQPATVFKDAVYQVTGVPPDRMKVMIKGGVLKVLQSLRIVWEIQTNLSVCVCRMTQIGKKSDPRRSVGHSQMSSCCFYIYEIGAQ